MNESETDQEPNNDGGVDSANVNRGKHPIHPAAVSAFRAAKTITKPRPSTQRSYGDLSDSTTHAEYAWEFLRRNRFFQQLVDQTSHRASLDEWAYRASPDRESWYGIGTQKSYAEPYELNPPSWYPIDEIIGRTCEPLKYFATPHKQPGLDYPKSQVAIAFDICPIFGPDEIGLDTQSSIMTQILQAFIATRKMGKNFPDFTAKTPLTKEPNPLKEKLRKYLLVADLLSHPRTASTESKSTSSVHSQDRRMSIPTVKQAASLLPDHIFSNAKKSAGITDEQKEDRTYDLAGKARDYIYGWKCLNLLALDQWVISTPAK